MTSTAFSTRVRVQLRDEVLDAATTAIAAGGWPSLRMQAIAESVGVSRRTLYNEFGNKTQLAHALNARSVEHLAEVVRTAVAAATDLRGAVHDLVLATLEHADDDPIISAVHTEATSPDFLPLLTNEAQFAITFSTDHVTTTLRDRWPELPEHATALAAHVIVRLVISFFLQPDGSHADAADRISELVTGYLITSSPSSP